MVRCLVKLLVIVVLFSGTLAADGIRFPEDAGVIDVTAEPYGAVPDDGQDDTAAIQQALNDYTSGNTIFYFPDGTYDLSDALLKLPEENPLRNTRAALELRGSKKRNIFQGQSRSGTILRLMDEVPADFDKALLNCGQAPAQRFRNAVRNMTLSIGAGHPKATGLEFNASNQGTVSQVTIQSEDPEHVGGTGLDMGHTDEVGPLLVTHLTVDGFDVGIFTAFQTASQTFENIVLRNQRVCGWRNGFGQQVFARGVFSSNSVPVIINRPFGAGDPGQGKFLLLDSRFTQPGESAQGPAIRNHKAFYARDVTTSGYSYAITNEIGFYRGNTSLSDGYVEEYWANGAYDNRRGGPFELFPSPDRMLHLPMEETPSIPWEPELSRWAGPHQFAEGTPGEGPGHPNDPIDDAPAIQAAIDSGATTLYLPRGRWRLAGEVIVRGNIRRILGTEARLVRVNSETPGTVTLGEGTFPEVVIERLESGGIRYQHGSARTLILQHLLGGSYHSGMSRPGKLFINDVVFGPCVFRHQRVWARQLDIEGNTESNPEVEAKVLNDRSLVWILGMKTEDEGTVIKTINGGQTELYGALHVGGSGKEPRFVTIDSAFSVAGAYGGFQVEASETRNGETRLAKHFRHADIYTAFSADWIRDREVVVDDSDSERVTFEGTWKQSNRYDGGFIESGFHFAQAHEENPPQVTFAPQLPKADKYLISLHWPNTISGFGQASQVPVEIRHAEGTSTIQVNQSQAGGKWNLIGTFALDADSTVTIHTKGTRRNVIADAVRFERLRPR